MNVYAGDMKKAAMSITIPTDLRAPIRFHITPLSAPELPGQPWDLHLAHGRGPANHRARGLLLEVGHPNDAAHGTSTIFVPWTNPLARRLARALISTGWAVEDSPQWLKARLILAARKA